MTSWPPIGWDVEGTAHGASVHNMEPTREEVLAMVVEDEG